MLHSAICERGDSLGDHGRATTQASFREHLLVFTDEINIIILVRNKDKVFLPLNLIYIYIHTRPKPILVSFIKKEQV